MGSSVATQQCWESRPAPERLDALVRESGDCRQSRTLFPLLLSLCFPTFQELWGGVGSDKSKHRSRLSLLALF